MVKIKDKDPYQVAESSTSELKTLYNIVKGYNPKIFQKNPALAEQARSNLDAADRVIKEHPNIKLPKPDRKNPQYRRFLNSQKTFKKYEKAYQKIKSRIDSSIPHYIRSPKEVVREIKQPPTVPLQALSISSINIGTKTILLVKNLAAASWLTVRSISLIRNLASGKNSALATVDTMQ